MNIIPVVPSSIITVNVPTMVVESITVPIADLYQGVSLDGDSEIHDRLATFFRKKLLNKWLEKDYSILSYLAGSSDKIELISNLDKYKKESSTNDSKEITLKKLDFLVNLFLSEHQIKKVLRKLVEETGIRWVDLPENTSYVKKAIHHYLKRKLKHTIIEKSK